MSPPAATRWFLALVVGHVVVWTLLPTLAQPNAPLDIVEMLFFGREWQWGYYKHPPLTMWMAEVAFRLCGDRVWGVYLLSQLCVALCFWSVWRLAREFVEPRAALLAALLLEVSWNDTGGSTEFNNNVSLYPFWTLAILLAFRALDDGRTRFWIGTGAALGLGMLAKYTAAVLAGTMLLYMLADPEARRQWRRPGPWLALGTAFLVFLPHGWWAWDRGFPAIRFALERGQGAGRTVDHVLAPLAFAGSQLAIIVPTAMVLAPLVMRPVRLQPFPADARWRRRFLVAMVGGPFALCLLVAGGKGLWFGPAHGSQLWPYAGLLAVSCLRLDDAPRSWRAAWITWSILAVAMLGAWIARPLVGPHLRHKPSRIHFAGQRLAAEVEAIWRSRFDEPLPVAAGAWWLAANVALYGPSRAHVAGGSGPDDPDFSSRQAEWFSDEVFRRRGGVILWNADASGLDLPEAIRARFPAAAVLPPLTLPWQTSAPLPPLRVGIALLPPG